MKLDRMVGELTCREVLAQLSAFLDGELDEDRVRSMRAHVSGCSNCEQFGGKFQTAVTQLRGLREPAELSEDVLDQLCARATSPIERTG